MKMSCTQRFLGVGGRWAILVLLRHPPVRHRGFKHGDWLYEHPSHPWFIPDDPQNVWRHHWLFCLKSSLQEGGVVGHMFSNWVLLNPHVSSKEGIDPLPSLSQCCLRNTQWSRATEPAQIWSLDNVSLLIDVMTVS
jgi:hypothetical protein